FIRVHFRSQPLDIGGASAQSLAAHAPSGPERGAVPPNGWPLRISEDRMTAQGERLRATLDAEIKNLSTLEHKLARTKRLLQEQATRLRLGASVEMVLTSLRLSVLHDTTLAVLERIDLVPKSVGG